MRFIILVMGSHPRRASRWERHLQGANKVSRRGGCRDSNPWRSKIWRFSLFDYPPPPARKFNEPLPWYHFTTVMRHFLLWYHFTAVMCHFISWYQFTAWCNIFYLDIILLPWCDIFYLDIIVLPWCDIFYFDIILLPWCDILYLDIILLRDATCCTLISSVLPWCDIFYFDIILLPWWNIWFCYRNRTFSTLIS